jgi:hypothetical protein
MSVGILAGDDEPDVADLFRQHFRLRREARQSTVATKSGTGVRANTAPANLSANRSILNS